MAINVNILGITGTSPFDIYICQSGGTDCYYMLTTSNSTYNFDIPPPYDISSSYMLKVIDSAGCVITGVTQVI